MARPIRVEFAGAVYHVMARGNERKPIYRDDQDRRRFLETVAELAERFGVRVHAYCLMPNHYHLVVGTPRANLSRALGWLQVTYTVRFNRRHRRSGHLFQGRFKAQLVEADEYARWLVEYVHLNPVRPTKKQAVIPAERRAELDGYEWSSHRDYAGRRRRTPGWLCLDWLGYWGASRREAQAEYRKRMRQAFGQEVASPWEHLQGGLVLGGQALRAKAEALVGNKKGREDWQWTRQQAVPEWRRALGEQLAGETDERVKIWARVRLGEERAVDVGREYGYADGSGVGQVVRRLEQQSQHDRSLRQKLQRLKACVSRVQS